jgi:hypothetical protein
MDQGTTDVMLKKDNDDQNDRRKKVIQNPVESIEASNLGSDKNDQENRQADQHLHSPRSLNEEQNPVNDKSDQQNVEQIQKPPEICQHLEHSEHPL